MSLQRYIISSILVSITFGITAYVTSNAIFNEIYSFQTRGLLYFALIPYLFGALINKEGYWQRSDRNSNSDKSALYFKRYKHFFRVLRVVFIFLVIVLGVSVYQSWGILALKDFALVILGIFWGGFVTRAWFIYREKKRGQILT